MKRPLALTDSTESKKLKKSSCLETKCSLEEEKKSPCDESQRSLQQEILFLRLRLEGVRNHASHAEKLASLRTEVLGLRAARAIIPTERALGEQFVKHCIGSYTWTLRGEDDNGGHECYGCWPYCYGNKSCFQVADRMKYATESHWNQWYPGIPGSETDEIVFQAKKSGAALLGFRLGRREVEAVTVSWSDIVLADSNASFYCYLFREICGCGFKFTLADDFDALMKKECDDHMDCEPSDVRYTIRVRMSMKLLIQRVPRLGISLGLNYE